MYLFAEVFVKEGDKVLVPIPTFGEYERAVRNNGGSSVYVPCKSNFTIDVDRLTDGLHNGCKAVFLSSPNNPTSKIIVKKDLLKLIESAHNTGAYVFLDEAFIEFTEDGEPGLSSRIEEFPNLFVARSLTKIFALTGLRIGYGVGSRKLTKQLRKSKMPWSVNVLAQQAAIAALRDRPYLERSRKLIFKERDFLYSQLEKVPGLNSYVPESNFILSEIKRRLTANELKTRLLNKSILIRDCSSFDGLNENYFRVAVKLRGQNRLLLSGLKEILS